MLNGRKKQSRFLGSKTKKKLCAFHNNYGHLAKECRQLKWKIESLIRTRYLKESIPFEKIEKERYQKASLRRRTEGKNRYNGEVPVILRGFTSGEDTMVAQKHHIKKVEVILIKVNNKKLPKLLFQILEIVFTEGDAKGVRFSHKNALVIQLRLTNKLVNRILVDNGSLVDQIFKSTMRCMGWELININKLE